MISVKTLIRDTLCYAVCSKSFDTLNHYQLSSSYLINLLNIKTSFFSFFLSTSAIARLSIITTRYTFEFKLNFNFHHRLMYELVHTANDNNRLAKRQGTMGLRVNKLNWNIQNFLYAHLFSVSSVFVTQKSNRRSQNAFSSLRIRYKIPRFKIYTDFVLKWCSHQFMKI